MINVELLTEDFPAWKVFGIIPTTTQGIVLINNEKPPRCMEFPGGKKNIWEDNIGAVKRELSEKINLEEFLVKIEDVKVRIHENPMPHSFLYYLLKPVDFSKLFRGKDFDTGRFIRRIEEVKLNDINKMFPYFIREHEEIFLRFFPKYKLENLYFN